MNEVIPKFTEEQWKFLAVFEVLDCPVTIEMAGLIIPLLPGALINLITKAESLGWIEKVGDDRLVLTKNIPARFRKKLRLINTKQRLGDMLSRFSISQWKSSVSQESLIKLMEGAGREQQAGELEIELAHEILEHGDFEMGRVLFFRAATRHQSLINKGEAATLFIETVFNLSNLTFASGKGFSEIENLLHKVQDVSHRLGDARSHALAGLHLGWLYYFTFRREEALMALAIGAEEIEDLNDSDIRSQSALFLGLNAFIKGEYLDAYTHLEIAENHFESAKGLIPDNPMIPIFFGLCAAYLGKFHRAIGTLDFVSRLSMERSEKALSSTIRSVLGTILVVLGKNQQGFIHLNASLTEAIETQNDLGMYLARGGTAVGCFFESQIKKSYELLKQALIEGSRAGFVRQFASPWVLEMLYEYYQLGFDPIPDFNYTDVVGRIMNGFNVHLQGVAHRLRAIEAHKNDADISYITCELGKSETYLRKSGDPVQLSKTFLESARLALSQGNRMEASTYAKKAWHSLGGYYEEFFPVEFQYLLEADERGTNGNEAQQELVDKYLEMIESLYPSESQEEILSKVMTETCRMFGAERSAYICFPAGRPQAQPDLKALFNLSPKEISSARFKTSLKLIRKVFRKKSPIVDKITVHETALGKKIRRAVLCIPVEVKSRTHGVLYYDSSYLSNLFENVDLSIAKSMARHTNIVVGRRLNFLDVQHRAESLTSEKSSHNDQHKADIISQSLKMIHLKDQADKIAVTNSTVLILGETGTGKELLANRIYRQSLRSSGPFVVVDSATIPDTLLESELFGHEKGSFTGADKRKIGCIEMAHGGTLFLDEIGELTRQAQTKLLRTLQEKNFRRVGGLQAIGSDFRLIGATNRDLEEEVRVGRFREDLFFRLNVISLVLPPLRERENDAVELAGYFLKYYAKKHNRQSFALKAEHKEAIQNYTWPGNIRELKNLVERAVILSKDGQFELNIPSDRSIRSLDYFSDRPSLNEIQRRYINFVLEQTRGKISGPGGALEILEMKRTSLYSRMKALGMERSK